MNFNIDVFIVVVFLTLTLIVGLFHGQKVINIKDYALGGRNFTTSALVATIVATYASGSSFFVTLSKTYSDGLYHLLATIGTGVAFFITAFFLIPRMEEFLGKVSIAEAMGDIYGTKIRLMTAIAAAIGSAGLVAVQFKVLGGIFSYFLSVPSYWAIILAGLITTIYSAFGGIRAVTFTDILQFFAFGFIIPLLGFIVWSKLYYSGHSLDTAMSDPKFNLTNFFSISNPKFIDLIFLFIYFSIPTINAPKFQRISMASSLDQVQKAFVISGLILIVMQFAIAWIPFIVHIIEPNISPNNLLNYIIDEFSFVGLRGLILMAIIAFSMSTADSRINASSILFAYDIYGLVVKNKKKEVVVSRIFGCILGIGTIILSLVETDVLGIIIFANSFYDPLIIPPFILTLFGFRSSAKSVLIGMIAALVATILCKLLPIGWTGNSKKILDLIFAMFCNVVFLLGVHYMLKESGGWIKNNKHKQQTPNKKVALLLKLKDVRFKEYFAKISPINEMTYTALGIYFIVCTTTTMYSTQIELLGNNRQLMIIIYPLMLVTGTVMAMYPLWPLSVTTDIKKNIINIWYPVSIFYMLILSGCFFVLVSKFANLQVSLFIINLMISSLLLGWRLVLSLIIVGFYMGVKTYQYFFGHSEFIVQFGSPEFILTYTLLILSLVIIIFIKPKQEYQKETEAKVGTLKTEVNDLGEKVIHYSERVSDQEKEIERLGATAQKILNNVNHELCLPIGNAMNFAKMLNNGLGKLNEQELRTLLSDAMYQNSNRLASMILNMLDLATLDTKKLELNKKTTNLSKLVKDRVNNCRKIYLEDKNIDFEMDIHSKIFVSVDPNYIKQVVDNLVINAIKFSQKGKITVKLLKQNNLVKFSITDNGIGIPKEEIYDVFTPFKMGSNTESKAEGRGVGLALCKTAIEAHQGSITAQSDGKHGATFTFTLDYLSTLS